MLARVWEDLSLLRAHLDALTHFSWSDLGAGSAPTVVPPCHPQLLGSLSKILQGKEM